MLQKPARKWNISLKVFFIRPKSTVNKTNPQKNNTLVRPSITQQPPTHQRPHRPDLRIELR